MNIKQIILFLFEELKIAVNRNDDARISDLGTAADILHQLSIKHDEIFVKGILESINYIVLHYDEEPQYIEKYFEKIEKSLESLD